MKYFILLTLALLCHVSVAQAGNSLTVADLDKAVDFAKTHYPISTSDSSWILIDEDGQATNPSIFLLEKIRLNCSTAYRSPFCYLGKKENKWYLLVDDETAKEIEVPKGLDVQFILSPDAYVLSSVDGKNVFQLFQPSTGRQLTNQNIISGFFDGIVIANPPIVTGPKANTLQSILFNVDCKELFRWPTVANSHIERYQPVGEGIICRESFALSSENASKRAKDHQATLFDLNMKKIADIPKGWTLHCPFSNGVAVFVTKIDKPTDPVQYAFVDSKGGIIKTTKKEIVSGREGIYCFLDLKTFLKGYIDTKDREIFPAICQDTTDFYMGKAFVKVMSTEGQEKEIVQCYEIDTKGQRKSEITVGHNYLPLLFRGIGISVSGNKPGLYKIDGKNIWTTDDKNVLEHNIKFYQLFPQP